MCLIALGQEQGLQIIEKVKAPLGWLHMVAAALQQA